MNSSASTFKLDSSCVLVVEGLPIVTKDKAEKLMIAIKKEFGKFGTLLVEFIEMPFDGENSIGICFLEYAHASEAQEALKAMNNNNFLTKKIVLHVYKYADFEMLVNYPEEFVEPTITEVEAKTDLSDWLMDEDGRDQYLVRYASETEIYWNDPLRNGRVLYYGGEREKQLGKNITDLMAEWSPMGSYLATMHDNGVVLWGSSEVKKIWRLAHKGVKNISFSPCERYLMTYSGHDQDSLHVWDLRTGASSLTMPLIGWPQFKWSFDGSYFARICENGIEVMETSTMKRLEGGVIKVQGIQDFSFSPTSNILSYWTPENGNVPARVVIMSLPNRVMIRDKHLVFVTNLVMHWHNEGTYLLVHATRQNTKTKKPMPFMVEIFALLEKNVPVESFEVKDNILSIAWESNGKRFAILSNTEELEARNSVTFYSIQNGKFALDHVLTGRTCTSMLWAPTGSNLLLVQLPSIEKSMEFYDVVKKDSVVVEHPLATDFSWDPSGRYLISSVTQPLGSTSMKLQVENGYRVWNAKGKMLNSVSLNKCYSVAWRPRPPTLITPERLKEIKKNLKETMKKMEANDKELLLWFSSDAARERKLKRDEWESYRSSKEKDVKEWAIARQQRFKLEDLEIEIETIEEILE